jgi:hypothetical protein
MHCNLCVCVCVRACVCVHVYVRDVNVHFKDNMLIHIRMLEPCTLMPDTRFSIHAHVYVHSPHICIYVNIHIYQVQLQLRKFHETKSAEGHKRYVRFRNTRGQ